MTRPPARDSGGIPRGGFELSSGLALEAFFGADAATLLSLASDPCYPVLVDDLLEALSDGTFEYRDLWRELEGERDPVAVTRQLLAELSAWTSVEPELLAWAVAGAWLRRREAAAGRSMTAGALARERRALEGHVRSVLDVPADLEGPVASPESRLHLPPAEMSRAAALHTDAVEWIVDVRHDWSRGKALGFSASPYPLACFIVEQVITPFDDLAGAARREPDDDEQDEYLDDSPPYDLEDAAEIDAIEMEEQDLFGDEDDEDDEEVIDGMEADGTDEGEPRLLSSAAIGEGEDEAGVSLGALAGIILETGRRTRPERIVFRQRGLAARLGDTLRDAGFDVTVRYFCEAVELTRLDPEGALEAGGEAGVLETSVPDVGAGPGAGRDPDAGVERAASDDERRAYARLVDAARRSREPFESMRSIVAEHLDAPIILTLAQPLPFPVTTFEGADDDVVQFAVTASGEADRLTVWIYPAGPNRAGRFECERPGGGLLLGEGDVVVVEVTSATDDEEEEYPPLLWAAGLRAPEEGPWVVPMRYRRDAQPAFLRGRELEIVAGVMEAVAALLERQSETTGWEQPSAADLHVEPLGNVKVEWRPT